jgi:hypothetical protein
MSVSLKQWGTSYANAADDGAPYVGPVLLAGTYADALALLTWVVGPNLEPLKVEGEILERIPADTIGDTHTRIRRVDDGK